jgi:hypothetical protein
MAALRVEFPEQGISVRTKSAMSTRLSSRQIASISAIVRIFV